MSKYYYAGFDDNLDCIIVKTISPNLQTTRQELAKYALKILDRIAPEEADRDWDVEELFDKLNCHVGTITPAQYTNLMHH